MDRLRSAHLIGEVIEFIESNADVTASQITLLTLGVRLSRDDLPIAKGR